MTAAEMAALHAAAFEVQRPWTEPEFAALLASPLCFSVGGTQAFALVRVVAGEAELLTIATHPDARRQGRAKALMSRWETQARIRGAEHAFLEVASDNDAARALYEHCGYDIVGERPGYYARPCGDPANALLMRKVLT